MSSICEKAHQLFTTLPMCRFPFDPSKIPQNGIYVLFEKGEWGHGKERIVRVGTHTGSKQLPSRLRQHFISENKDRSIFRKNVGRALLNKANDPFLEQWEIDLTTSAARQQYAKTLDRVKLQEIEKEVSEYIQSSFHFIVFRLDDKTERLKWESAIISTVAACSECGPSEKWLGLHSPKEKIRTSGLWLVNELYKKTLVEDDIEALKGIVLKPEATG